MGMFGALAPFGLLEFGEPPSLAERLLATLRRSYQQGLDVDDAHMAGTLTARALALASMRTTLRHAFAQRRPGGAVEFLGEWENLYRIPAKATETPIERRRRLARRMRFPRGPRFESVWNALLEELGSLLLGLKVADPGSTPATYPASPGTVGAWQGSREPGASFRLLHNISTVGTTTEFQYARAGGRGDRRLAVGATYCFQAENSGLAEAVTIEAVSLVGEILLAEATFTKPHDAGASIKTHSPWWITNQRRWWILLREEGAKDPAVRARVDGIMSRLLRASSVWHIIFPPIINWPTSLAPGLRVGVPGIGLSPLGDMSVEVLNGP